MIEISELFWKASVEEIVQGYVYDKENEAYICLICGEVFEKGIIYKDDNLYFEAERFVKHHINQVHSSMFDYLIDLNKKFTGLTDHQKNLLRLFHEGLSDAEVVKEMGGGSTSTIRNHRFTLREREKQAKVFLAIMQLLEGKNSPKEKFITIHRGATMIDERYAITEEENEKILNGYFRKGPDGPLQEFPVKKEKRKIAILRHIAKRFQLGIKYTEKEVNEILKAVYEDYVLIRRYLIEYGFMERERDCSQYWIKE
ncbi:DUF2087 domain-containing protein [Alkaliphilus serpentinus]|uniref:DUF2087 domain-containing protein n=1 Tax=Alkaliphilus serpentinus TaxID=1482731 RepID=A0A833HLN3_9FIRM|nr:DUF2087 domain-containing protein [Alkaliphilus serpentinus]KAB3524439.1 DUF2087 domain-containing protein [Alkaliphilus serpentinus]